MARPRAEDALYITGYLSKARDGTGSWYEAIEQALRTESQVVRDDTGAETALTYPLRLGEAAAQADDAKPAAEMVPLILDPLAEYQLRRIVRPSSALADGDPDRVLESAAEAARVATVGNTFFLQEPDIKNGDSGLR